MDLRIIIKGAGGSVLNSESVATLDTGSYDRSTDPQPIEFWYVETGSDVKMSAGDAIKITGMSPSYEGATVIFKKSGEQIGSITLPTDFS